MKKVLLLAAFGVAGLVSANDFSNVRFDELSIDNNCTSVNLSCGVSFDICNFQGGIDQFFKLIEGQEKSVCGKDFDKDRESLPNLNG